jgi:hypothetical protein
MFYLCIYVPMYLGELLTSFLTLSDTAISFFFLQSILDTLMQCVHVRNWIRYTRIWIRILIFLTFVKSPIQNVDIFEVR